MKKVLLIGFIAIFLIGCNDPNYRKPRNNDDSDCRGPLKNTLDFSDYKPSTNLSTDASYAY